MSRSGTCPALQQSCHHAESVSARCLRPERPAVNEPGLLDAIASSVRTAIPVSRLVGHRRPSHGIPWRKRRNIDDASPSVVHNGETLIPPSLVRRRGEPVMLPSRKSATKRSLLWKSNERTNTNCRPSGDTDG